MAGGFFRKVRIMFLLYVLLIVAGTAWLAKARSTDWDDALRVAIYPINGDGGEFTSEHIASLSFDSFNEIENYFEREADRYGLVLDHPVDVYLSKPLDKNPPLPPAEQSPLGVMWWSLKLRYWAWRNDNYEYPKDIKLFVIYFDPEKHKYVRHSLGLQKGLIGIVNVFSGDRMERDNKVIIAHELLHTIGATDKYDAASNLPFYPAGYAEPEKDPILPQDMAEIMGGRIPVTQTRAKAPESLDETVIGEATAMEIRWLDDR